MSYCYFYIYITYIFTFDIIFKMMHDLLDSDKKKNAGLEVESQYIFR